MCGINGMILLKGFERSELMLAAIRHVFDQALVETQDRGHHATGLATFNRINSQYGFYKAPNSAEIMATYDNKYDEVMNAISDNTTSIISHTRWYTKGKPENNENNHPFDIGSIVGVHNGTVSNDDSLFLKHKEDFTRKAEVDSEIVYQLINHYNKDAVTHDGLKLALESSLLSGMFALVFANKNQPNLVHIVKQERPMDFVFWEEAGVILFNSEKKFIDKAFDSLFRAGKRFGFWVPTTTKEYELKKDKYITINADAETFADAISEPLDLLITSPSTKPIHQWSGRGASSCGTGSTGCGDTTKILASDSIGTIIEGALDNTTGEIVIFAPVVTKVGDNDDGIDANDEVTICVECQSELQEHELRAAFNEGATQDGNFYCSGCHQRVLNSVFTG